MTDVRLLGGDDWQVWREIRLRALRESPSAFASTYAGEVTQPEGFWRDRLGNPDAVSLLATEDGTPVGMGGGYPDRPGLLHVVAMWVEPSSRGRGVGHALLRAIEGWADTRGLALHLDVNVANAAARRAYERYGFVGTGETEPLREGSAERVERMLLPTAGLPGAAGAVSGRRGSR